jgi:hypothetical protein
MSVELSGFTLDRMQRAVEKVRERLIRATAAIEVVDSPLRLNGY